MRPLFHPERESIQLTAVLAALSDLNRLEIVQTLTDIDEKQCGTFETAIAKSTLSHHLKVLREAGVTRTRVDGTQRYIALRRDDLEARFPGLLDSILAAVPPL